MIFIRLVVSRESEHPAKNMTARWALHHPTSPFSGWGDKSAVSAFQIFCGIRLVVGTGCVSGWLAGWLAVGAAAAAGGDGGGVVRLETDGVAADYDSAVI